MVQPHQDVIKYALRATRDPIPMRPILTGNSDFNKTVHMSADEVEKRFKVVNPKRLTGHAFPMRVAEYNKCHLAQEKKAKQDTNINSSRSRNKLEPQAQKEV
ncbi:hypothetical protein A1O3_09536 [Capronia epimyces CBS 606.96]|uniref:Uncharacterized protein n=1 Tax=Capronia epimyces CBS 606.96 TaxID=1182542 RepID=W9XM42_9EURO|nr:uncharacterized protein A1O3_09536 [Capronia epimyces CBS 606.96]EXJ78375.1 hypothetical protein A1O3_09536 [Capronia epimyces CBS 606.96]